MIPKNKKKVYIEWKKCMTNKNKGLRPLELQLNIWSWSETPPPLPELVGLKYMIQIDWKAMWYKESLWQTLVDLSTYTLSNARITVYSKLRHFKTINLLRFLIVHDTWYFPYVHFNRSEEVYRSSRYYSYRLFGKRNEKNTLNYIKICSEEEKVILNTKRPSFRNVRGKNFRYCLSLAKSSAYQNNLFVNTNFAINARYTTQTAISNLFLGYQFLRCSKVQ